MERMSHAMDPEGVQAGVHPMDQNTWSPTPPCPPKPWEPRARRSVLPPGCAWTAWMPGCQPLGQTSDLPFIPNI